MTCLWLAGNDCHSLSGRQALCAAGHQPIAWRDRAAHFDDIGQRVDVRDQPGNGLDLVTCTYNYPGFPFLVYGAFAFSGHA